MNKIAAIDQVYEDILMLNMAEFCSTQACASPWCTQTECTTLKYIELR